MVSNMSRPETEQQALDDHQEVAREWFASRNTGVTDEMVERAVLWVSRVHHGHASSVPCIVCIEATRAALNAALGKIT